MPHTISKRLRLTQKGYEKYSGPIGQYEFKDGLSVEAIPLVQRDRLSAAFEMAEINEDGTEAAAGVAERILRDRAVAVEPTAPCPRQTEEEKAAENIAALIGGEKLKPLYTVEYLEAVAADRGIAGVRELAEVWGAKSKSIPELIAMIEKAQKDYITDRTAELTDKGANPVEVAALFALKNPAPEVAKAPVKAAEVAKPKATKAKEEPASAVAEAAKTGDLAAALNAE